MPPKGESTFTQQEITQGLIALIAWAGNANAACRALEAEGKRCPTSSTLAEWARSRHADEYQKLHERYADQLEGQLISEFRMIARHATDGARLAIEKTVGRLADGKDNDPARTAANLATVADKATGKVLALSGRPTSIREDRRNPEEILRSLIQMGVIKPPEDTRQLDASGVEEQAHE